MDKFCRLRGEENIFLQEEGRAGEDRCEVKGEFGLGAGELWINDIFCGLTRAAGKCLFFFRIFGKMGKK